MTEKIIQIINSKLINKKITCEQANLDFRDLGVDSLTFIQIIVAIEEEYDIEISDEFLSIEKINNANALFDIVSTQLPNCSHEE